MKSHPDHASLQRKIILWDFLKHFWEVRYGQVHFRLLDINCIAYLSLTGLLLMFFHKAASRWPLYILIHVVYIIAILEIVRLGEKNPHKKILWILRTFYPVTLFMYGWKELNVLVRMFFDSYWATDVIIRMDKFIFGVHPTIWAQHLYQPWLDEFMSFFYTAYYTFFVLIPLILFICKKKEAALAVFSVTTFVYFSNYLLFCLFPVVSPKMHPMLQSLQIKHYTGYLIAQFNQLVQADHSVMGASFPSSHVSGALAWALSALRYSRKMGFVALPIAIGVGISSVYLGLHHAVDSLFGIL
jgi:membrane-associated phospholipid phosphatase